MGKLLIIPRSDTTRDNARVNSKGEAEERTTATEAIVVGSSATSGAIADSAAADRDRRFLIASILGKSLPSRECENESRPISGIVDATKRTTIDNVVRSDLLARNIALHAEHWNTRIAVDDGRTCCFSSIDVAPFFPRRRARDRAISCDHFIHGRSSFIERRNRRRAVSSSLTRSRSVTASLDVVEVEKASHNTVDDVTIEREAGNRFSVPYVDSADRVSKCDGCTLSDSSVLNNASRSPRTVLKTRESIDVNDTGNVWANNNIDNSAGLIGLVKSSCIFSEEIVNRRDTSSSSRFPARIDRNGQTWRIKTHWRLPRTDFVLRTLLLGLLVMSLICDLVLAAPSSSSSLSTLEAIDTFEDSIEEEELVSRNKLGNDELEIIRRSIVQGLGLQRIPDPSKVRFINNIL